MDHPDLEPSYQFFLYGGVWIGLLAFPEIWLQKPRVGFVIVGGAAAATAMLWFRNRYGKITAALVEFTTVAALLLLTTPSRQHILSNAGAYLFAAILFCWGFGDCRQFFMEQHKEWQIDRARVEHWWELLRKDGNADNVVEIRERSFKKGDVTYRFLNTGDCWAVATLRIGKAHISPPTFRIRELGAITLVEEPDGTHTALIDGKVVPKKRAAGAASKQRA